MSKFLVLLFLFSINSFSAEYTAKVFFDLSQNDAYTKLSSFIFWHSYKGAPTLLKIQNARSGEEQIIEQVSELSVSVDKSCYKKLKSAMKSIDKNPYQYVMFEGRLDQLKIVIGKKSKIKFKALTNCDVLESLN